MGGAAKPMRFSLKLSPHARWGGIDAIAEAARLADAIGPFDLQLPDHIIMPVVGGAAPADAVWYDNFVLAAHLAALTKRIRFIFYVLIVPYRPPVQTAKLLATLDVVSGGRVTCGVGVGWLAEEFRLLGVPFAERGAITEEYLRAMKALWTEENPSFAGRYVAFSDAVFLPKPVQKPHPPLWIGGSSRPALRRAVALGDGWVPMAGTLDELAPKVRWIKEQRRAAGRDPAALDFAFQLVIGERDAYRPHPISDAAHGEAGRAPVVPHTPEAVIEAIGRYQEAGFNHLSIRFNWRQPADLMREMEWFAAKVLPAFRQERTVDSRR